MLLESEYLKLHYLDSRIVWLDTNTAFSMKRKKQQNLKPAVNHAVEVSWFGDALILDGTEMDLIT